MYTYKYIQNTTNINDLRSFKESIPFEIEDSKKHQEYHRVELEKAKARCAAAEKSGDEKEIAAAEANKAEHEFEFEDWGKEVEKTSRELKETLMRIKEVETEEENKQDANGKKKLTPFRILALNRFLEENEVITDGTHPYFRTKGTTQWLFLCEDNIRKKLKLYQDERNNRAILSWRCMSWVEGQVMERINTGSLNPKSVDIAYNLVSVMKGRAVCTLEDGAFELDKNTDKLVASSTFFSHRPVHSIHSSHIPTKAAAFTKIQELANFFPKQNQAHLISWILTTLTHNTVPFLVIQGKKGSGKSTLARKVIEAVGGEQTSSASLHRTNLDISLSTGVKLFDNVSGLKHAAMEEISAAATDGDVSYQPKYSNEWIRAFSYTPIITCVSVPVMKGDLIDRVLHIKKEPLERRTVVHRSDNFGREVRAAALRVAMEMVTDANFAAGRVEDTGTDSGNRFPFFETVVDWVDKNFSVAEHEHWFDVEELSHDAVSDWVMDFIDSLEHDVTHFKPRDFIDAVYDVSPTIKSRSVTKKALLEELEERFSLGVQVVQDGRVVRRNGVTAKWITVDISEYRKENGFVTDVEDGGFIYEPDS